MEGEDDVPYDMIMLMGLHSIWRSRMTVRHADVGVHPVYKYFVENMSCLKEVYKAQQPRPEWLSVLEALSTLKDF